MGYKVEKEWESNGYPCVVLMTDMGHRCGYVGVPEGHRLFGIDYDDARRIDGEWIDVHGGLTYAGSGEKSYPSAKFNKNWWFGYDCAHLGDAPDPTVNPEYSAIHFSFGDDKIIRSLDFCIKECEGLAAQLN